MKVLVFSDGYRRNDDRTRINFIKKLTRFKDISLNMYGPRESIVEPELALVPYDERMTEQDILSVFKPDILFFILYNTTSLHWIPKSICKLSVPSIILEEDHYDLNYQGLVHDDKQILDTYSDFNFSLLLRRHYYKEEAPIPSVWLPFSADDDYLFPTTLEDREKKVAFAGSVSEHPYYRTRMQALEILKDTGLLAERHGYIRVNYREYLQNFIAALTCGGGMLHTCLAKTFEVPLCGTVLLTNWLHSSDLLFGNKQCFVTYKDDCGDIVDKVTEILNDIDMAQEIANNAVEQIIQKHTDSCRLLELYNILIALYSNKEIPRIWGQ